ncbi:MAG TPA: type IV pilus modification protein PilV [Terriglobales bacterium]|nr:type IV pilus modification protein PilV [Terriglobales bacterium]
MKLPRTSTPRHPDAGQRGFTMIEVMISLVVLTIGLIALLATFGVALASTQSSQEDMIAKQLASEAMENIFTARDTDQVDTALGRAVVWGDLQNVSNGGIFVDGAMPINQAGADGIIGTVDDGPAMTLAVTDPNGTLSGKTIALTNFQRTIVLTNVAGTSTVRQITIVITYTTPRSPLPKTYTLSGYISQYR